MTETWKGKELGWKKSGRKVDPERAALLARFNLSPNSNSAHKEFVHTGGLMQLLACKSKAAQRLLLGRSIQAAPGETWAVPDMRDTGRVAREEAR